MCANHEFNYALTFINGFLSGSLQVVGEGRRRFVVIVWEVQSIAVGACPTPRGAHGAG